MSFECGQQRVMRLGWERPGSLASRRVLTNRMREYFTYGSVGGAGGNPGSYPAPNPAIASLLHRRHHGRGVGQRDVNLNREDRHAIPAFIE